MAPQDDVDESRQRAAPPHEDHYSCSGGVKSISIGGLVSVMSRSFHSSSFFSSFASGFFSGWAGSRAFFHAACSLATSTGGTGGTFQLPPFASAGAGGGGGV